MDRLIYIAMTGAKSAMGQQSAVANNLANVSTNGFRAEIQRMRAVPVLSQAQPTRAFAVNATVGADFKAGPMMRTGNPLDMAIHGNGWFAVRDDQGREAYTRNGSFKIDATGALTNQRGQAVLGDGGPIVIPPDSSIEVGPDGTITATPLSGARNTANVVGRLKLVDPPTEQMQRGDDSLFRTTGNTPAPLAENVRVAGGYVEGSNVNVVEQVVNMVSAARNYELHTKMLQNAQENDRLAAQIVAPR